MDSVNIGDKIKYKLNMNDDIYSGNHLYKKIFINLIFHWSDLKVDFINSVNNTLKQEFNG